MNFSELKKVISMISEEKNISKKSVTQALEYAFVLISKRKFGLHSDFEAKYHEDDGELEIFNYKKIVDLVKDPTTEIALDKAQELDPDSSLGEYLGIKLENINFSRVEIQQLQQTLFQRLRDSERDLLFSEFKPREGEIITGIVRKNEGPVVIIDLGKTEAVLYRRETIFGEDFVVGDKIQALLSEVVMSIKGPEIRLSRTSPLFLVKLLEQEIPEVQDGTIEIKAAAREPGQRAKISVISLDRDIDPVGTCVGVKGSRIQTIINELQGERIDVIRYDENIAVYAKSSLSPAEIHSIRIKRNDHTLEVVLDDDQLALGIGKRGQNVRLAAMLINWKINIITKTQMQEAQQKFLKNLLQIPGLKENHAQILVQKGINSLNLFHQLTQDQVINFLEISQEEAMKIIDSFHAIYESSVKEIDSSESFVSASALPGQRSYLKKDIDKSPKSASEKKQKFSEAEKRLREELAAFKI
jgi:N utilization substance protein A